MISLQRCSAMMALAVVLSPLCPGEVVLHGGGATFPDPLYQRWITEFEKSHAGLQVKYDAIGSGGGIQRLTEGTIDFSATDGPMNADQLAAFNKKNGFGVLHVPTVLGAAVPIYNVPGVSSGLNFTADALAGIFLGRITKWNDPALTSANPNVKLPSKTILVIHRSDGSGLTYCWTDYLSQISSEWKNKVGTGTSVNWPVGIAGRGNDGVTQRVKSSANSIGYVELMYAGKNQLDYGNVRNAAGVFVKPDLASIKAAAATVAGKMPDDFRVSLVNTSAKDGYPISTFTWLLVPEQFKDRAKAKAMTDFVHWALTKGQSMAEPLTYSPLPPEVIAKAEKAVAKIR